MTFAGMRRVDANHFAVQALNSANSAFFKNVRAVSRLAAPLKQRAAITNAILLLPSHNGNN